MAALLLCAGLVGGMAANATVSISFNETLAGFDMPGGSVHDNIADFEAAYKAGKEAGRPMGFGLSVTIPDVAEFLADPARRGVCRGTVWADTITDEKHVAVGPGGAINIFDQGVHVDPVAGSELGMEYHLPFVGEDGKNYELTGIKHMPGDKCLGVLTQITTLYCHVREVDNTTVRTPGPAIPAISATPPGQIVRKGIARINVTGAIKIAESLRVTGGTKLDQLTGFLDFGLWLVGDLGHNCLNLTKSAVNIDYLWASDGSTGTLVGMVRRPDTLELRLVTWTNDGKPPTITREQLPLSFARRGPGWVGMGPLNMSEAGCTGTVNGTAVGVRFDSGLGDRNNTFLPEDFKTGPFQYVADFVPIVKSRYGTLAPGSTVGGHSLKAGSPSVWTSYDVPIGLGTIRWGLVSASQFAGTDLQIEVVASPLNFIETIGYLSPMYVRLDGKEYHQDTTVDLIDGVNISSAGGLDANQTSRTFAASIRIKTSLVTTIDIQLTCTAPVEKFVFLEKEGNTYIHTTVMADCTATVKRDFQKATTFVSKGCNLVEAKE